MATNGDIGGREVCSNGDVTTVFFQNYNFSHFLLFSSHPVKIELDAWILLNEVVRCTFQLNSLNVLLSLTRDMHGWWSLSHTWHWKVLAATIWNNLRVTFFKNVIFDVRRYYGFCYFILKTWQTYHNFWYNYCS